MHDPILGGLTPRGFLRTHWQRRPLLVRGALPGFQGVLGQRALAALAARSDVESRLVRRSGMRWQVTHGPIARPLLDRCGRSNWTLLVSGVNLHVAAADRLLRRFAFIPQARLDDVMVSYAVPGGGVGPHFDSYDVFLLQGGGRRRWRICRPRRFTTVPEAPLRLIEGFVAEDEYLVEPGDLLYLPPGWGHDGVALEPGCTVSIGFRAPRGAELAAGFLDWLHARGLPDAEYRDPGLKPATHPAQVPDAMCRYAAEAVRRLRWSRRDIVDFLGEHLSVPKPNVVFARPRRRMTLPVFARRLKRSDAVLDPKTQLLYRGARYYVNGDAFTAPRGQRSALAALADARRAGGRALARAGLADLIHAWYCNGYLQLEAAT